MKTIIDKLYRTNNLSEKELSYLVNNINSEERDYLYKKARESRYKYYGNKIYIRGLLEISNHCIKECLYCGINRGNKDIERYRLTKEEIIESCKWGYDLGLRTFVLQGGEDNYYNDELIVEIIKEIKAIDKDIAVTLSLGEKSYRSYERYYKAGADRYLLRHETADKKSFNKIHRIGNFESRKKALYDLKEIGYQVGAGFMVGIPGENKDNLVKDILFLKRLDPAMVGIGPFIPHESTRYKNEPAGDIEDVLLSLALTRLFLPEVLLPATTALSTIHENGRKLGFLAGCNVIMPNLSPMEARKKYNLYRDKAYTENEAVESLEEIEKEIKDIGLEMDLARGDNIKWR